MASSARASRSPEGENSEFLYCHACQNEWYRLNESLTCPRCQSSFTEIIENPNNPEDSIPDTGYPYFARIPSPPSPRVDPYGNVGQPNEAQSAFGGPRPEPRPERRFAAQNDGGQISDSEAVFRRFTEMLMNDFGAGRAARGGPGSNNPFSAEGNVSPPGNRVHHTTTVRTGPFGSGTSVTVTSRTIGGDGFGQLPLNAGTYVIPRGGHPHSGGRRIRAITIINNRVPDANEPLRLFDQLFGNPWGVADLEDAARRERGAADPAFPLMGGLQQLLNTLYNPASAVRGDAVFTQEALDRIVTQLMEASPQTNAAPPATQAAIEKLEKKQVDDAMLGGEAKAECTICIDEIKKGDEVSVLPCKHWYHGDCVILWLKEHNTCPICRMPIEGPGGGENNSNNNGGSGSGSNRDNSNQASPTDPSVLMPSSGWTFGVPPPASLGPSPFSASTRPASGRIGSSNRFRSARENMERLDSIRNLATGVEQPSSWTNFQRQSSHAPPGAWPAASDAEDMGGTRARSPSGSRDRDVEREGDGLGHDMSGRARSGRVNSTGAQGGLGWSSGRRLSQPQHQSQSQSQQQTQQQPHHQSQHHSGSGNGPFGWLRDHFGRRSS